MPALLAAGNASVVRYPDDPQIWNNLGEIRTHCGFGMRVGVSARAALDPFARAIALDSSFAPAYVHSVQLALEGEGIAERLAVCSPIPGCERRGLSTSRSRVS